MRKRESRHKPWIFFRVFFCSSNMLVRWVASSVKPLFGANSQKEARKFSSAYIFVASVQQTVFNSARLAVNPLKKILPLPSAWCRQEEHPCLLVPRLERLESAGFFPSFLITISALARPFGDWLLIYLFIFQFQFSTSHLFTLNWVLH